MIELSRRQMLWGATALGGGTVLGVGWISYRSPHRLVSELLMQVLPDLNVSDADMLHFTRDFTGIYFRTPMHKLSLHGVSVVSGVIGTEGVSSVGKVKHELADAQRAALTLFLSNSDFFLLDDPKTERVSYWGLDPLRACPNPFARF